MNGGEMDRRGFTLIELLVVILILSILAGLVSPVVRKVRENARRTQAVVEMQAIEGAVTGYFKEYGRLPMPQAQGMPGADLEMRYDESGAATSREILQVLSALDEKLNAAENRREIVFIELPNQGGHSVEAGTFLDPWGHQYRIALDLDYDGYLALDHQRLRRRVAVASVGLYVQSKGSDTNALLRSWLD
jgi:prepilin-type N-terminal cleavage/methylation domain-containing protein